MPLSQLPSDSQPPRMEELARLPLFMTLAGRRVVIAGGNPAAAWKAELLSATGARVDVYAVEPCNDLLSLAGSARRNAVTIHRRELVPPDCAGAAIAVGAIEDDEDARRFATVARAAGVLVNIVDKPDLSDFAFGAIVNRSPLVIGISTDGAAPVFAQAIRARIERMIPRGFARWAEAARALRPRIASLGLPHRLRRLFWERFTERAINRPDHVPSEDELSALIADLDRSGPASAAGALVVVGGGSGDPELLTLRAVRALQCADVIVMDQAVTPQVVDFARREAKKLMVHAGDTPEALDVTLMIALAKAGRRIVWLTDGDPGQAGSADAVAACRAAGIAVEVVPAVSGVSLTNAANGPRLGDERPALAAQ